MKNHFDATKILAVFDLDKTIIKTNLFVVFLKFALSKKMISKISITIVYILFILSKLFKSNTPIRHGMYFVVSGFNKTELGEIWREHVIKTFDSLLITSIESIIMSHKKKCHKLILITNNLDFLVTPVAELLGFDKVVCLETITTANGRIIKHIPINKSIGINKAQKIRQISFEVSANLTLSYGYGDSKEDFEFLSILGNPYLVKQVDFIEPFKPLSKIKND